MGPAKPQTLLQVVDILDIHGTPASPGLPQTKNYVIVWALRRSSFRLEVSQAVVVQVVQAVRTLVARQPAGTTL